MRTPATHAAALALAVLTAGSGLAAAAATAAVAGAADAASRPTTLPGAGVVSSFDGSRIHYRVSGAGAPVVVLVHGWSCDSSYWDAQVPLLAATHTVVTIDLAGHGASEANRSEWSMQAFGRDVAAVVNALPGYPRVVLIGHSMGGPVIAEAAVLLGDRVAGLIGVDTFKAVGLPKPPASDTAQRMAQLRADFPGTTRGMVAGMLFRPDSDPALVRRVADDMAAAPPEVGVPSVIALNEWDGPPVMRRIRAPIVTINADLGPPTPESVIRGFAPGFRVVVVPGSDHFLMMSDPARVNPILEAEIRALQ